MRFHAVCLAVFTALISTCLCPASAQPPPPAGPAPSPQVNAHAAWDKEYIYFAFAVDDTDIRGINSKPMSDASKDDSVAVYLHTGKDRPDAPNASTNGMIVSVAGGFQFVSANPTTKAFGPHPLFSIKYGVKIDGTINRSDDRDRGYSVTLAIPLKALAIDPKTLTPGLEIACNIVVRRRDGLFSTLTANGKPEAEALSPKNYQRLILAGPKGDDAAAKAGALVAPLLDTKSPLITGVIKDGEWPTAGAFRFASPDVPKPIIAVKLSLLPGSEADAVAPPLAINGTLRGMERRILARYLLAFQGDGRKSANPFRGIYGQDGSLFLAEQPATGIGPWFSVDRTGWHRGQLTELRRSGIDAALVTFGGPENELGALDEKSLLVMAAALREMSVDNIPTPEIAPNLDLRGLVAQNAPKPDLGTEAGRAILYQAIHRWFDLIPAEYRFRVALPPDAEGRIIFAYPFFLDAAEGITNSKGPEWSEEMRKRFAQDFGATTGGTTLLFIGGEGFSDSPGLVATAPLRAGGPGTGPLKTFVVQPGVAAPEVGPDGKPDQHFPFVARRAGATYRENWDAAIASQPTWVILDSWNDYLRGTTIDVSRQYARQYIDATRISLIQASGLPPRALHWLANDAPRRMRPGQLTGITVTVANTGSQILGGGQDIGLTYRWRKGKEIVSESPLRLRLTNTLLPSQTIQLSLGVFAARMQPDGTPIPLPAGDYTLEIDLAETRDGKAAYLSDLSPETTSPLRVPVTVMPLADAVEFASTTTSPLLMSGANYGTRIRLRWLGDKPLTPDAATLVYQLLSEDGKETIFTGTCPLSETLTPGNWITIPAIIRIGDPATPVVAAAPEFRKGQTDNTGGYQLRWLLTRTDSPEAVPGQYVEHVGVYPLEEEARVSFGNAKPLQLNADALTTLSVSVTNRSTIKWSKDGYRVGYHWYYADGIEQAWKPAVTTPLNRDVAPGETVTVSLTIRTPDRAGVYILAADVLRTPDTYLSTRLITRTGDLGLLPVEVSNGRLQLVDLRRYFNGDAVSAQQNAKDGDFDGSGSTFPAEMLPPDAFGIAAYFADDKDKRHSPAYPSGYVCDGSPASRQAAFRYGGHGDQEKNVLVCSGQSIPLQGKHVGLHLAIAASGGADVPIRMTLRYKTGAVQKTELTINDWSHLPGPEEAIAVMSLYRRTPAGDSPGPAIVRHLIIPVDPTRELLAIDLPKENRVKIFGMTLEQ